MAIMAIVISLMILPFYSVEYPWSDPFKYEKFVISLKLL